MSADIARVPREPTPAMLKAGAEFFTNHMEMECSFEDAAAIVWESMWDAWNAATAAAKGETV